MAYDGPTKRGPIISGKVAHSGCVIRLGPNGIYLYHNRYHVCAGVREVSINSGGEIQIDQYSAPGPVLTCGVWMDERVGGQYGVTGGISGGVSVSQVRLYSPTYGRLDLNNSREYNSIASDYSNVWCSWTHLVAD